LIDGEGAGVEARRQRLDDRRVPAPASATKRVGYEVARDIDKRPVVAVAAVDQVDRGMLRQRQAASHRPAANR
jgi:hypothetical protein